MNPESGSGKGPGQHSSKHSSKRVVINNSFWLLLEQGIVMGGTLGLSILFARGLGPENFGHYSYVLSFVALFGPLFALGLSRILLREFDRTPQRIPDIIQTCFQSRLLSGVVVTLLTAALLYYFQGYSWKFKLITVMLIANISNAFEVYGQWFQYRSDNRQVVLWRLSCFVLFGLLKAAVLLNYQMVWPLIVTLAAETWVRNIGFRWLYRRDYDQSADCHQCTEQAQNQAQNQAIGQYQLKLFLEIFSQSKFLIFSTLASIVYLQIDILMLEMLADSQTVGIYAVAAKLSSVWYILPQVVLTALFPKLLEIARKTPHHYRKLLQQGFDWLFISALLLGLAIYAVAPWVIDTLYGQRYSESAVILRLHIFAATFIFMRALLAQWLVSERFAEFSLFSQLSGAVSNVLLNLWLIPLYGGLGAAIATLVSYAITTYFCLWCFQRTRPIAWMMTRSMGFVFRLREVITVAWQTVRR